MQQKLLFLQLQRANFPMDPWTLAEVMQIPNFGPPPKGADTVMERWVAWKRMEIEQQAEAQKMALQLQQAAATQQGAAQMAGAMHAATQASPQEGRPATAQVPPHIAVKSDGRSTIAETK